jgi:uncharacterized protein
LQWQFAVGAIVAALHDIILILGLFVLTGIEFNLTSVAALLTIIGYSLNDTVVVYDRMRENLKRYRKMPLPILIDASINQTLSRTVLTAATTMLALAALALFGGEVIRSFAFIMLAGVAVGTFSSIYIAAPVLIVFKLRPDAPDNGNDKKAAEPRKPQPAIRQCENMARGIEIREAHFPGRAPLDTYGNGGFRFADMSHRGSILCLPSGIHGWEMDETMPLSIDNLQRVINEASEIEFLLLGTGVDMRPIPAESEGGAEGCRHLVGFDEHRRCCPHLQHHVAGIPRGRSGADRGLKHG